MGAINLSQIKVTPLKKIGVKGGDVLHALKFTESDYRGFGEAYFSFINFNEIKAWKT
jgi:dTDP-4-dehydrorhamnose 3,5-epimerase